MAGLPLLELTGMFMIPILFGPPRALLQVLLDHQELLPSRVVAAEQGRLPPGNLTAFKQIPGFDVTPKAFL